MALYRITNYKTGATNIVSVVKMDLRLVVEAAKKFDPTIHHGKFRVPDERSVIEYSLLDKGGELVAVATFLPPLSRR